MRNSTLLLTAQPDKYGLYLVDKKNAKEIAPCEYDEIQYQKSNILVLSSNTKTLCTIETNKGLKVISYSKIELVKLENRWLMIASENNNFYLLDIYGEKIFDKGFKSMELLEKLKPELGDRHELLIVKGENEEIRYFGFRG